MYLKALLLFIQICILTLQVGCLVYAMKKNKGVYDVLGGFGIWGALPNVAIAGVIFSL